MTSDVARVLQLGDPRLRQPCTAVEDFDDRGFVREQERLSATLGWFRKRHGFGRAIAAPQIGVGRRFLALDLGDGPFVVVNPEITWRSEERFTMWDDCMSFPSLLVRVERHASISLRYRDEQGTLQEWDRLPQATSELLQHEIDHLDGVLAIDRATDREAIISRDAFDSMPEFFQSLVDYVIE